VTALSLTAPRRAPWARVVGAVDEGLGRIGMARLVVVALSALLLGGLVQAALGQALFAPIDLVLSVAVVTATTLGVSAALARLRGTRAEPASSVITALLIVLMGWPSSDPLVLGQLAATGAIAAASKFVLVRGGRHLFNPAAVGAVLAGLLGVASELWWAASGALLPVIVVGGAAVLIRSRTAPLALAYAVPALLGTALAYLALGLDPLAAAQTAVGSTPILLLAAFMLTEPLTLPPHHRQRMLVAGVVALVTVLPVAVTALAGVSLSVGAFAVGPALAVLVGNLVAACCTPALPRLRLASRRLMGRDLEEFRFTTSHPLRFAAGQYLELGLPGYGRRVLSIASAPGRDELRVAVRMAERPSRFKRRLRELEPGDRARIVRLGGDFVAPAGPALLIAAGIGVTPFLAQLADDPTHDAVLLLALRPGEPAPFREELARVRVIVAGGDPSEELPSGWRRIAGRVDAEALRAHVPDIAAREALVSGAPRAVAALAAAARAAGAQRVRTDAFAGY